MKDGIIKGTGNSRYLKGAGWPSTYAEFKSMAEAGTLPFDLSGINAAGWQQIGDALNKANLLSDTTAAKLNGVETPNAAFDLLSRFHAGMGNEYVWQRSDGVYVNSTVSNAYPPTPSDGYTYTPLGQIGNKVQIATGSYTGTGTYGSGNPITLNFGIDAKILILASQINVSDMATVMPIVIPKIKSLSGKTIYLAVYQSRMARLVRASDDVSGNTSFKFYCSGETDAAYANPSGYSVTWVAIG